MDSSGYFYNCANGDSFAHAGGYTHEHTDGDATRQYGYAYLNLDPNGFRSTNGDPYPNRYHYIFADSGGDIHPHPCARDINGHGHIHTCKHGNRFAHPNANIHSHSN